MFHTNLIALLTSRRFREINVRTIAVIGVVKCLRSKNFKNKNKLFSILSLKLELIGRKHEATGIYE